MNNKISLLRDISIINGVSFELFRDSKNFQMTLRHTFIDLSIDFKARDLV